MQPVKIDDVVEKLRSLPPERVAEVKDFVDFLAFRERESAFSEFLSIADSVERSGVPAMRTDEIEAEINAYRNERQRADRT